MMEDITDAERSRRPTRENIFCASPTEPKKLPVYCRPKAYAPKVRTAFEGVGERSPQDVKDDAFLAAAGRADAEEVANMLRKGQEVNVATQDGTTAVALACEHDNTETLEALLAHQPNVMHANRRGDLPISAAIRGGHEAAVKLLISTGRVDLTYTK